MSTSSSGPSARSSPASSAESEASLLARAQSGDQRAFRELVRLHEGLVRACALKMLRAPGRAEDAAQETFLRAWRALARFDARAKFSTWLYRICVNVCLNIIRGDKRHQARDVDEPGVPTPAVQVVEHPDVQLQSQETIDRVQRAVEKLSPALRSAVVLVLLQDLSYAEAGEILGCAEGTVAWRVHEARKQLRGPLADLLGEPT